MIDAQKLITKLFKGKEFHLGKSEYLGPGTVLDKKIIFDKNMLFDNAIKNPYNIQRKYIINPTSKIDYLASLHDILYTLAKDDKSKKHLSDKWMLQEIQKFDKKDKDYKYYITKIVLNSKLKLGMSIFYNELYKELKINKIIKQQNNLFLVEFKNYPNKYELVQKEFLYNI